MTCEICGEEFQGTRCSCGWHAPSLEVKKPTRLFSLVECTHPGCTVMIRSLPGQQGNPLCKWHQQGTAYHVTGPTAMRPESHLPVMTKEEFGLDLYEAIKANGARLQCEKMGKTKEAKAYQDQVQALLPKLKPDDVRRILNTT